MYQGSNRVIRAELFIRSLSDFYVSSRENWKSLHRNQYLQVVRNVGHVARDILFSGPGARAIFGNVKTSKCNICGSRNATLTKPNNYVTLSLRGESKNRIKCKDLFNAGMDSFYPSDICLSFRLRRSLHTRCGCSNKDQPMKTCTYNKYICFILRFTGYDT
jgi:hypothetical protein